MKRFTGWTVLVMITLACVGATASSVRTHERVFAPMPDDTDTVTRIGFGSCFDPTRREAWSIWDRVREADPDLFMFIGDCVYADTRDPEAYAQAFADLEDVPGYVALRERVPVVAVWDDHDYGLNDSGADFGAGGPINGYEDARRQSQDLFLDAFGVPENSPRRSPREGIYDSMIVGPEGRRLQIILLDTRYNRSDITKDPNLRREDWVEGFPGSYTRNTDPGSTILGEAQWRWLEEQLRKPAEARLIATSIQFVADDHRFEKWGNFPHERARLIALIEKTKASGVFFISGDRHRGELSREDAAPYPLYDLTSSAMNRSGGVYWNEVNTRRDGALFPHKNFGIVEFDWDADEPTVSFELRDEEGTVRLRRRVRLDTLRAE
ncbi:MAG: hypothetical protein Tsb0013_14510 [Phycisphaerales bacterium]